MDFKAFSNRRPPPCRTVTSLVCLFTVSLFANARRIEVRSSRECGEIPKPMSQLCQDHKGSSTSFWYAQFDSPADCAVLSDSVTKNVCLILAARGDTFHIAEDRLTKSEKSLLVSDHFRIKKAPIFLNSEESKALTPKKVILIVGAVTITTLVVGAIYFETVFLPRMLP